VRCWAALSRLRRATQRTESAIGSAHARGWGRLVWRRFSCLAVGRTKVTVALMLTGKYRMVKFAFREMPVGAGVVMMRIGHSTDWL
jgi:hypothetical protein